ncbi:ABC transporter permease subunit [Salirhabdus salicampi]|uniref:ABC transporter permease subunit n=1 Tax=Salirhabdus salicampi TaxID=476102 RepID=UPI0020C254E2|nr:ABC transporter permease subunit [Salirhabdus salicampi]MCP8617392.1 ABC transporter permease subunit [Salirhabdus salicampi]
MRLIQTINYFLLGIFGIICISVAPKALENKQLTNSANYLSELFSFIKEFLDVDNWVFVYRGQPNPIWEYLWEPYIYSMQILLGAILGGFVVALILAITLNFLPKPISSFVKRLLNFLEAIPDLLIAVLLQWIVIEVMHRTGISLFRIASLGGDQKAYAGPILTLAILPLVSLFKIFLLMIEEEFIKSYVEFAKSKGIKKFSIIVAHVIKNIFPSTIHHSKVIIWGSLSSLFIVERVFNVRGVSDILLNNFNKPMVVAFILIMLFTPFFVLYNLLNIWAEADIRAGVPVKKGDDIPIIKRGILYTRNFITNIIWPPAMYVLKVILVHMKNVKFAIGFLFLIGILVYSYLHTKLASPVIDQVRLYYNPSGKLLGNTPHEPTDPFFLGSDRLGYSIWDQIVVGAKYTILFAFIVAVLRIIIGFLLGTFYTFKLSSSGRKVIDKIAESSHFLPLSIIAYAILHPILIQPRDGWETSFFERVVLEIIILTILVIPVMMALTGNEIGTVMKNEFILSAIVLGGGPRHMLTKHILPHIGPRMTILFGQQFIQVLLLLIHLGFFQLYFGGTVMSFGLLADPPQSYTNEWSGLIGNAGTDFRVWPHLVLPVLIAFMLVIFAMQLIVQGVKEVQQVKVGVLYKFNKTKKTEEENDAKSYPNANVEENQFQFTKQNVK